MRKLRTLLLCSTVAGLAAAALPASAAPVLNGSVNIDGLANFTSTQVLFKSSGSILAGGQTGDFTVLAACTGCITLNNFTYNPFTSSLIYSGVDAGHTVSFTSTGEVAPAVASAKVLALDYNGDVTLDGVTAAAEFVLSINQLTNKVVGSISSITATVPEPASLAILGVGLLGLCLVRPKHNRFS